MTATSEPGHADDWADTGPIPLAPATETGAGAGNVSQPTGDADRAREARYAEVIYDTWAGETGIRRTARAVMAVADAGVEAATRELRAEVERLDGAISAVLALAFDARRSAGGSFTAKVDVLSIERALTGTALARVGAGGVPLPVADRQADPAADTQPEGAGECCGHIHTPANVPVVSGARGDAEAAREARYAEALTADWHDATCVEGKSCIARVVHVRSLSAPALCARVIDQGAVMAVADEEQAALRAEVEQANRALSTMDQWLGQARRERDAAEDRLRKVAELAERGKLHQTWRGDTEMVIPVADLRAVLAAPPAEGSKIPSSRFGEADRSAPEAAEEGEGEPDGCRLNGCHPAPVSSGEAGTGEHAVSLLVQASARLFDAEDAIARVEALADRLDFATDPGPRTAEAIRAALRPAPVVAPSDTESGEGR